MLCKNRNWSKNKTIVPPVGKDEGNPCVPSPCGPNSQCRVIGNQGACSCLPNYIGRPPNCRPECTNNAECPSNKACQNERCVDPCPGYCGHNALCRVVKHNPKCTCNPGYEGDPLLQCTPVAVTRKIYLFYLVNYEQCRFFVSPLDYVCKLLHNIAMYIV